MVFTKRRNELKKLNKICYYAQAWYAALMYDDENSLEIKKLAQTDFEAWVHGPVSPEIYNYFVKKTNYKQKLGMLLNASLIDINMDLDQETEELLEKVWLTYGDQSGFALEMLSHSEAPWRNARKNLSPNERSNNKIELKDMHDFYLSIYNNGEE